MKTILLRTALVALGLSGAISIYAFLVGDFGELEVKILLTTLSISYFSLMALGCAMPNMRYGWLSASLAIPARFLVYPGLALALVGVVYFPIMIWAEVFESEILGKAMFIIAIFSFSFAQASVLSIMRLEPKHFWVFGAAVASIMTLGTLLSVMLIFEIEPEWLIRITGCVGIADGCLSLSIPILVKLRKKAAQITCPKCGHQF